MFTPAHLVAYCQLRASGGYGWNPEIYSIFCEAVERRLACLPERDRFTLILAGHGYTQKEIAKIEGISLRTVSRRMPALNRAVFWEMSQWLGAESGIRNYGKGRPRRVAA